MVFGYVRVSTKGQETDGYSLEQQESEILDKYENAVIYTETYTATTTDRPILNDLISNLKANDVLVVTKLDRLARNTEEGIELVKKLFKMDVAVHVLNVGLLENTSLGKFFLTILLAVAEMERNTIVERTQKGKEIAKLNPNYVEGRPKKYTKEQLEFALSLLDKHTYNEVTRMTRISKATLLRAKAQRDLAQNEVS